MKSNDEGPSGEGGLGPASSFLKSFPSNQTSSTVSITCFVQLSRHTLDLTCVASSSLLCSFTFYLLVSSPLWN